MKSVTRGSKSTTTQKRKGSSIRTTTEMEKKITRSFPGQVAAFIKRYRPALEALAKQ